MLRVRSFAMPKPGRGGHLQQPRQSGVAPDRPRSRSWVRLAVPSLAAFVQ